jgi:hypothetical protein
MVNPVLVWRQQVFIALKNGRYMVWGSARMGKRPMVRPIENARARTQDVMYRYVGMFRNENADEFLSLMAQPKHRAIVEKGSNIGLGVGGATLLQASMFTNHADLVAWLLVIVGANPNAPGRDTDNPTCMCTLLMDPFVKPEIARCVHAYAGGDASLHPFQESGETALHYAVYDACKYQELHHLYHCLTHGGRKLLGIKDQKTGETPLALAVRMRSSTAVRMLLEHGANAEEAKTEETKAEEHENARDIRHYHGGMEVYAAEFKTAFVGVQLEKRKREIVLDAFSVL